MEALYMIGWIILGLLSYPKIKRMVIDERITLGGSYRVKWTIGDAFLYIFICTLLGPIVWGVLGIVLLVTADFWDKKSKI